MTLSSAALAPQLTATAPARRWRILVGVLLSAIIGPGITQFTSAQAAWQPRRPVELVVPSAAGGAADLAMRTLQNVIAQHALSREPVVVVNRPGGGGSVSLAYLNGHANQPDRVALQSLPLITNRLSGSSTVGLADVTPLAEILTEPQAFSVSSTSRFKDGAALIEALRQDPRNVTVAVSSSPGGQSHLAAALLLKAAGVDPGRLKIVFFDSGSEAITALMGGHVDVTVTSADIAVSGLKGGRLRIIATPAARRLGGELASVPTWKEQGIDLEFNTWRVLVGPKGMTTAQIAWWDNLLKQAIASPEWAAAARRNMWTVNYKDSTLTQLYLNQQNTRLGQLFSELNLSHDH